MCQGQNQEKKEKMYVYLLLYSTYFRQENGSLLLSRQEQPTPRRSSWEPGRTPPPECGWSELPRVCSCLAISFINKLRGGREETTTPPKKLVRRKPCLQAEEPVILKSWSETKPSTVRSRWILPTKLLPPDPLPTWRPTTPSPNSSSILTTFIEKMTILNPC